MKEFRKWVVQPLIAGFLFLVPIYLAILLLLKAMKSLGTLVKPRSRITSGVISGRDHYLPIARFDALPPRWDSPSHRLWASHAHQNGKINPAEDSGVRSDSEYDPATGGTRTGKLLATRAG